MTEPNATDARNDNTDEGGELANQGPIPPAPEDATDTGEKPGDLAAAAGGPGDDGDED